MWQPKTNIPVHNIHSSIHLKWAALTFIILCWKYMYIYFLLSKCEFLSDKKNQKPLKIKCGFSSSIAILYFLSFIWGEGDTAVYETGFFFFYLTKLFIEKSRITVFNIHAYFSMSLIVLICFYSATTR